MTATNPPINTASSGALVKPGNRVRWIDGQGVDAEFRVVRILNEYKAIVESVHGPHFERTASIRHLFPVASGGAA